MFAQCPLVAASGLDKAGWLSLGSGISAGIVSQGHFSRPVQPCRPHDLAPIT